MNAARVARRFLVPRPLLSGWWMASRGVFVSFRAEVEWSPQLEIGRGSVVGSFTKIKAGDGPLRIGAKVDIGTSCFIAPHDKGIAIGDDCLIGPNVSIVGNSYRYDRLDVPIREQGKVSRSGIRIAPNVLIGAGCVILDGADIGNGAIVTPNSVVASRIPPNAVAQGNPVRVVFTRR